MEEINSTFKHLEETLNTTYNNILNFNVYFTPISVHFKKSSEIMSIFEKVKSKFGSVTKTNLQFQFSIIPSDVPNLPSILEQMLYKSYKKEPQNMFENTLSAYGVITGYSFANPLEQKLLDYKLFLDNKLNIPKGLNCILHELEDYNLEKAHGIAIKKEPYALISISRPNKTLVKHILHEMFHCLGAEHSYLPFNIMYPTTNSLFSSPTYLNPFSKKTIKRNINNLR